MAAIDLPGGKGGNKFKLQDELERKIFDNFLHHGSGCALAFSSAGKRALFLSNLSKL